MKSSSLENGLQLASRNSETKTGQILPLRLRRTPMDELYPHRLRGPIDLRIPEVLLCSLISSSAQVRKGQLCHTPSLLCGASSEPREAYLSENARRWSELLEKLTSLEISDEFSESDHLKVVQMLGGLRLIQPFNWNAWGAELVPFAELDQLDIHDCVRHITRIVRADRFSEGILAGAARSRATWHRARK